MGSVKNRIGDSQLTIEFLDRYKPREIERYPLSVPPVLAHGFSLPRSRTIAMKASGVIIVIPS